MAQYIYSRKTVTAYIKKVCVDYFEFDIAWNSRNRDYVLARCIFYKLCRKYDPRISLTDIGKTIGRNHATVYNGLNQFDNLWKYKQDDYLINNFIQLEKLVFNKRIQMIVKNQRKLIDNHGIKSISEFFKPRG